MPKLEKTLHHSHVTVKRGNKSSFSSTSFIKAWLGTKMSFQNLRVSDKRMNRTTRL